MSSTPSMPAVPKSVLGRTAATVLTSQGAVIVGEIGEQDAGWLRIRGSASGGAAVRDWWLPITQITAIQVSGDA